MLASGDVTAMAIAVDRTNAYWTTESLNVLFKVPLAGGTAMPLVKATDGGARFLALDAAAIYYTTATPTNGKVMKAPLSGGTPVVLADGQAAAWGIAVDGTDVYWANAGDGTVMRLGICESSICK